MEKMRLFFPNLLLDIVKYTHASLKGCSVVDYVNIKAPF